MHGQPMLWSEPKAGCVQAFLAGTLHLLMDWWILVLGIIKRFSMHQDVQILPVKEGSDSWCCSCCIKCWCSSFSCWVNPGTRDRKSWQDKPPSTWFSAGSHISCCNLCQWMPSSAGNHVCRTSWYLSCKGGQSHPKHYVGRLSWWGWWPGHSKYHLWLP